MLVKNNGLIYSKIFKAFKATILKIIGYRLLPVTITDIILVLPYDTETILILKQMQVLWKSREQVEF